MDTEKLSLFHEYRKIFLSLASSNDKGMMLFIIIRYFNEIRICQYTFNVGTFISIKNISIHSMHVNEFLS